MFRAVFAVVAGFALMVVITMLLLPVAILLGPDRMFKPGSFDAAPLAMVLDLALGVIAALAAGAVCAMIARSRRPAIALAVVVVLLGLPEAIMSGKRPDPGPRTGSMTFMEAIEKGRQPAWYFWVLPVIGVAGVLVGSRLVAPRAKP